MIKNLTQWFIYAIIFMILLIPFTALTIKTICGGIILGFFAGLLNDIRIRIKNKE